MSTRSKKLVRYRRKGKGKMTSKKVAHIAMKTALKLSELKTFYHQDTFTNGNTWDTQVINGISQGDLVSEREGNTVLMQYINMRYFIQRADATNIVRVLVVQWFPDNVQDPFDMDKVLQNNTSTNYALISSYASKFGGNKFRVLHDRTHFLTGDKATSNIVKLNLKGFRRKAYYDGSTATTQQNGIYVCMISDSAAVNHPEMVYTTSVRFREP